MPEYWQDVVDRAQATHPVWVQYFPTLKLGTVTVGQFEILKDTLPEAAQTRDDAVQAVDQARQTRDNAQEELRILGVKVPEIIEGMVDEASGLLDDLDKVRAVKPFSADRVVTRGKLLAPVWGSADIWQLSRTPPLALIVRNGIGQETFLEMLGDFSTLQQGVRNKEQDLDEMRGALYTAARNVEKLCVRFLTAARGLADAGSAADAALDTIPTSTSSTLPETLGIRTFTQGGTNGLQLLVAYEPYALSAGETAVLQYQRVDLDPGWSQVAYDASGNALGPFLVGQTVKVRTKVTNASGSREGGTRQLTLITPPS